MVARAAGGGEAGAAPASESVAGVGAGGHSRDDRGGKLWDDAGDEYGYVQRDAGDADELECDEHHGASAGWSDDGECGGDGRGRASNAVSFSVTQATAITVTVSPKRAAVTTSQVQQFTATVSNDPQRGSVTWSVDGNNGGTSTSGTISSTGLFSLAPSRDCTWSRRQAIPISRLALTPALQ